MMIHIARVMAAAAIFSAAFAVHAAAEREIPQSQGTHVNPSGDTITITSKCIRRNGVVQVPVMGEMHYVRVPADEWRDYVRKMKEGGVTIVATYVFWIHHEEKEGVFDFSGRRDIRRFLEICQDEGVEVVLRIGPWAHGECLNGGFPDWAVEKFGGNLRTTDEGYLGAVEKFWRRLFREVDGCLFKQGGSVIGIQLENECRGPWPYMMALKNLAVKCGFDVPFYTRTGWPQMKGKVDFGEILPLFGDYADGFWCRDLAEVAPGEHRNAFRFSNVRVSANIATEQLPQAHSDDQATAQYPFFTCELGGGMASAYHRRVRVTPLDTYAMALVKLGCGSNLLGYYMYAGGTNPNRPAEGVFFNECQASKYTNHNDLPPFSYEFQAPISEFGEPTGAWGLLKNLHKFCANFADDFALDEPEIISETDARRGPFHFHNTWVRGSTNIAERTSIPRIFPRNWKTRLGTIKSATAQPVEWDGDTLVLMKIPGVEPRVEFEGDSFAIRYIDFPATTDVFPYVAAKCLEAKPVFRQIKPAGPAREITLGPRGVAQQPSEEDWENAAVWEIERASCLTYRASCLVPRASGDVPGALCLVPGASCDTQNDKTIKPSKLVPRASCLVPGASCDTQNDKTIKPSNHQTIKPSNDQNDQTIKPSNHQTIKPSNDKTILEVDYLGDCARVYVDDVPVADDFYKGLPLRCALWRLPEGKITIRILPWTDSPLIYVEPPCRPTETGAKINSLRLITAQ